MPSSSETPCELGHIPLTFFGWAQQVLLYVIIVRFLRDRMARPYPPVWRTRSRRNPIELNPRATAQALWEFDECRRRERGERPDGRAGAAAERTRSTAVTATDRPRNHGDTSDHGRTRGSGDARPGRCDRHHDSGGQQKRPCRKRAGSVHELSCQAQDCAGDERGNWSRIPRNELMWRAGEGPLPPVGLKQCSDCWSSRQCPLSGAIRRTYTLLAFYCS